MTLFELSLRIKNDPKGAHAYLKSVNCPLLADRVVRRGEDQEYWAEFFIQGKQCIDYRDSPPEMISPWVEASKLVKELDV